MISFKNHLNGILSQNCSRHDLLVAACPLRFPKRNLAVIKNDGTILLLAPENAHKGEILITSLMQKQVDTGAKWLDEVLPDWWQDIDTNTLDMHNSKDCVMAKIAVKIIGDKGSFHSITIFPDKELAALGLTMSSYEAQDRGFISLGGQQDNKLTKAWIQKIEQRVWLNTKGRGVII